MLYLCAFDISTLGLANLTVTRAAESDAVISLPALRGVQTADGTTPTPFMGHGYQVSSVAEQPIQTLRLLEFATQAFHGIVEDAIEAEMVVQGWADPTIQIAIDLDTGAYTFSAATDFGVTFGNLATRNLFGFGGNLSGSNSYTSTQTPDLIIRPTLPKVSDDRTNFEPSGIASQAMADDSRSFGIARGQSPLYRDWDQRFETKEKTLRLFAETSHPMTYQRLFEHCRTVFPFFVTDGFNGTGSVTARAPEVFKLRADGSAFVPERATPGNDAQFHIPFRAVVEGFR